VSARRRLSTSWMLTLRAPSFHVGAGRAFTRPVPTSDASCRHPAPARRFLPDRQLEPRALLSSARGLFHREARIVPPSPRLEEPSPLNEKMEERLEAPSVMPNPLPASADPRGLSATHTQRLAAPDRAIRRAVPVTFWHDACAPFRSAAGPSTSHSAARTTLPFST